jgi:hypothetical protein
VTAAAGDGGASQRTEAQGRRFLTVVETRISVVVVDEFGFRGDSDASVFPFLKSLSFSVLLLTSVSFSPTSCLSEVLLLLLPTLFSHPKSSLPEGIL